MVNNIDYSELTARVNSVLEVKRKIVGVKFIYNENEFDKAAATHSKKKMSYCRMVKEASNGKDIKSNFDNFGCFAGARALGIVDIDEGYKSGAYYDGCGLYQDLATAKEATDKITICNHSVYGVQVKPLEAFSLKPEIVIIITNPFNAMRLVQGYTYNCGPYSAFKMMGNQAICSECTAYPYETDNISFSLLCAGARKSGFDQNEVGIGITLNIFRQMVAGLCSTVTPVENNQNKKLIEKKLKTNKITDVGVTYNNNYGDKLRRYDLDLFLK
ncbi:uncharacterized protein (DUF169 family) [Halanaerobium saccharolyticum]|uniref:Uncharacterized protein (DUF169 family) n=1 Tax=Halanaerobium saccharolyticum TaxID=43595 RepID=A0A4V3G622_9FIRM|nr:DUF169 domain-containing protein [Halanaerobium saccharolyticum]RAK11748.1 uncharacterized protein (DUF169 family) [Halanaerobium saccharolyticum]TDW07589.1 uncharacterized protein (DUF169 family) [Halanaerobium saccharolyticum]TDX64510.1 uncharacterized protein (DUF169 family) [Halanaerobium saccharolyticum]